MSDKQSDFLANLMRAKQTMDAVEGGSYKVDHAAVQAKMGGGEMQLLESLPEGAIPNKRVDRPMGNATASQIENSKLPDAVKKLMMEKPIPKMEMGSGGGPTFTLADVQGMVKKSPTTVEQTQASYAQQPQTNHVTYAQPTQITETVVTNTQGKMLITLTEAELDKKINDALMNFMTNHFTKNLIDKSLREETIKKTITTLIKEGKLKVKTKTRK